MKSNITDEEAATANEAIRTYSHLPEYAILAERERDAIVIYASEGGPWSDEMNASGGTGGMLEFEESLSRTLGGMLGGYQMQLLSEQECNPRAQSLNERLTRLSSFSPNLKFRLKTTRSESGQRSQKQQLSERRFEALRYHFTHDNWRYVAEGTLEALLRSCVPHIGKESYYEL